MGTSFFSYSRADQDFALRLADDLRKNGIEVWCDQFNIPTGSLWDVEIETALKNCDTLIVIISSNSVKSKNVLDEISYAIEENKRIIPVKFSSCEIPFRIRRLQHIDFSINYSDGFNLILKSYNRPITVPPIPLFKKKNLFSKGILVLAGFFIILTTFLLIKYYNNSNDDKPVHSDSTATSKIDKPILKHAINYDDRKFIFSETQAKAIKVVAMYPLQNDAYPEYSASNFKKELEYHKYIEFKNNGAFVSGMYTGNNLTNAIIGTTDLPYDHFDIHNFSISLNFKINIEDKAMPIFYIGENCRQMGIEISTSNTVFITLDNLVKTIPTFTKIESNVWNEIILTYTKDNISLYLNRELVSKYKYEVNDCLDKFERGGIKILSVNNAQGTIFKGYWKDLNIYTLLY